MIMETIKNFTVYTHSNPVQLANGNISDFSFVNTIKYPSNSSLSSKSLENAFNNASGSSCGTFNKISENTFSLGDSSESTKSSSLVAKTLFSDLESSANFPFESPLGDITLNPFELRNHSNLLLTFSSESGLYDKVVTYVEFRKMVEGVI